MSPKNLLRYPDCKSPLAEFDEVPDDHGIVGVRFKRLIMDEAARDRCVRLPPSSLPPACRFARPKKIRSPVDMCSEQSSRGSR